MPIPNWAATAVMLLFVSRVSLAQQVTVAAAADL